MDPYEEGKDCAKHGGQWQDNQYWSETMKPEGFEWIRGFREAQLFDPLCPKCKGTGKLQLKSIPLGGACEDMEFVCHCNKLRE